MGFTVAHPGGTKDLEFDAYARLLRQMGVNLSDSLRTPDPDTAGRWLYVWNAEPEAQAFADELKHRTGDPGWQVVPVNGSLSRGPLGPIDVVMARQRDGWSFALHPLSRKMIQERFPQACRRQSVFIGTENGSDHLETPAELRDLTTLVLRILSGLRVEDLAVFGGFRLVDSVARQEVLAAPSFQD